MTLATLFALLFTPQASAAPGFIPVQGTLADSAGTPIDGSVNVTFTLYSDSTTSTSVWTDTVAVDVVSGGFATELGGGLPLDLDVFKNYPGVHLVIQVEGDSAMAPVPLDHVPYAAWAENAGDAQTLGGQSLAGIESQIPLITDLEAAARSVAYDTEAELTSVLDDNYLSTGESLDWGDLTNVPAGFADGVDNDTQLSQATVEAYARGVAYNTEAELVAVLDDNYLSSGEALAWGDLTGVPAGFADGVDNDTQLSQAQVETWAKDAVAADGIPLDNGTNMTFEVYTVVHNWNTGSSQDFYEVTQPDGTTDSLIVETQGASTTVISTQGDLGYYKAPAASTSELYVRLTGNSACWLAHQDDDNLAADRNLLFATELNSNVLSGGGANVPMARFGRDTVGGDDALQRYATYKMICIP